jgi:hypothetical protein
MFYYCFALALEVMAWLSKAQTVFLSLLHLICLTFFIVHETSLETTASNTIFHLIMWLRRPQKLFRIEDNNRIW